MMNKKILPEIKQSAVFKNKNTKSGIFENMDIFKSNKNDIRFFTAITLPLILAACGGGGGGGAVSPTPDSGSGSSSSSGSDSSDSSATAGIELDGG